MHLYAIKKHDLSKSKFTSNYPPIIMTDNLHTPLNLYLNHHLCHYKKLKYPFTTCQLSTYPITMFE
jgi:hypothetical protein